MRTLNPTRKKLSLSSVRVLSLLKVSLKLAIVAIGSPISTLDRFIISTPGMFGKKYTHVGPSLNQIIVPSAVYSLALACAGTRKIGAKLDPFWKCDSVNPIAT